MKKLNNYLFTLKSARLLKGYTLEDAAKKIGVSITALSMYEKGIRSPSLSVTKKISDVYEIIGERILFPSEEETQKIIEILKKEYQDEKNNI